MPHPWPGNVRELENCIERMVVTSSKRVLDVDDLPPEILPLPQIRPGSFPVGITLLQAQEWAIRETLSATAGNRKEAARMLAMSVRNLHRKIAAYGLERVRRQGASDPLRPSTPPPPDGAPTTGAP
jgi:DNA-binding NtrC family response regulator